MHTCTPEPQNLQFNFSTFFFFLPIITKPSLVWFNDYSKISYDQLCFAVYKYNDYTDHRSQVLTRCYTTIILIIAENMSRSPVKSDFCKLPRVRQTKKIHANHHLSNGHVSHLQNRNDIPSNIYCTHNRCTYQALEASHLFFILRCINLY